MAKPTRTSTPTSEPNSQPQQPSKPPRTLTAEQFEELLEKEPGQWKLVDLKVKGKSVLPKK
ncbi:hypothetical protein D7V77_39375 [Corallococcus sp. CA041A]|nr:hypothetical protein D7V77_39375 [Corallococcus sp. CA041A]